MQLRKVWLTNQQRAVIYARRSDGTLVLTRITPGQYQALSTVPVERWPCDDPAAIPYKAELGGAYSTNELELLPGDAIEGDDGIILVAPPNNDPTKRPMVGLFPSEVIGTLPNISCATPFITIVQGKIVSALGSVVL